MGAPPKVLGAGTPAWIRELARATARAPAGGEEPDLRLRVLHEDGEALTVEVLEGRAQGPRSWLYLEERGLFAIVATLSRGHGGARTYLRLRAFAPALEWRA